MKNYRWIAGSVIMMITLVAYIDRINLSVAAPLIMEQFHFSAAQFGLILGAMIPGYVLFNIIGGFLVDRFAPIKVATIAIAIWSLATAGFTVLSTFTTIYLSRLIFGAAEGPFPPAQTKLYGRWMLPQERGRVLSGSTAFALLGVAIGAPLCGLIIKAYGWRTLFIALAVIGLLFMLILNVFARNYPNEHPWITSQEKELIEKALEDERIKKGTSGGEIATKEELAAHIKNPYLWLLGIGYFTIMCLWWANLSWLPGYLVKEKHVSILQSGIMSSFPYLMGVVGLVCGGFITDKLTKGYRGMFLIICQLAGPPFIFLALGATSELGMVLAFSVAMFFTAGGMSQFWTLTLDLFSTKFTGISSGIMSGVGSLGGMFTPYLMGRLYDTTHSFYWGFGSVAIIAFIGAIISIPLFRYEQKIKRAKIDKEAIAM